MAWQEGRAQAAWAWRLSEALPRAQPPPPTHAHVELLQHPGQGGTFWAQVFWLSLFSVLLRSLHWCLALVHLLTAPVSIFLCDQKQNKVIFFLEESFKLNQLQSDPNGRACMF